MRVVIPLLLLALACGRRGPDGAPAAPDVTTTPPPASSPVTPAPGIVSFARDPATGATLFADKDLGDVRHPPITSLGILERTDDWHVVAPPEIAAPDDVTISAAIASGDHEVWTWWTRESNAAHPAGGQLRRMTLRP